MSPSNRRIFDAEDNSSLTRMVKNSLTGPPPSMAGSPEKVFFIGTVKSIDGWFS